MGSDCLFGNRHWLVSVEQLFAYQHPTPLNLTPAVALLLLHAKFISNPAANIIKNLFIQFGAGDGDGDILVTNFS